MFPRVIFHVDYAMPLNDTDRLIYEEKNSKQEFCRATKLNLENAL